MEAFTFTPFWSSFPGYSCEAQEMVHFIFLAAAAMGLYNKAVSISSHVFLTGLEIHQHKAKYELACFVTWGRLYTPKHRIRINCIAETCIWIWLITSSILHIISWTSWITKLPTTHRWCLSCYRVFTSTLWKHRGCPTRRKWLQMGVWMLHWHWGCWCTER